MTKKKNCTDCGTCGNVDGKITSIDCGINATNEAVSYGYYSKLLQKPFDSLSELAAAEAEYLAEQKAKEDKAAQKKSDANKVEEAFKALNAARKVYKEDLTQLTKEYSEELENLKNAFELGKKDIRNSLVAAEEAYEAALKEFTDKYDNYHMCLKDGDFETTLSSQTETSEKDYSGFVDSFFNILFGI